MSEETKQIEQIRQRFETDFENFSHLSNGTNGLSLADAENLQREINELKTKHTGKKSELANSKKTDWSSRARRTRRIRLVCSIN
jgi:hypothetical protein